MPEELAISSTLGDKCMQHALGQSQQLDSRPIQGGTVSTSRGSPIGINSPANSETLASSQPATPQSLMSSQPSTPHAYSQPPTPLSVPMSNILPQQGHCDQRSSTPSIATSTSDMTNIQIIENNQINSRNQKQIEGYQPHSHTVNVNNRIPANSFNNVSSIINTVASGHTFSSNTITSVLAGRANTATVSINAPSGIQNAVNKTQNHQMPASMNSPTSASMPPNVNTISLNSNNDYIM